jgi:DNA-binding MarR family transcriptional regulator
VAAAQEAVDAFDEAAAERLALHRTDLRGLAVLDREGPLVASVLADRVGLSRPAMTAALDRLTLAGYVRRVHDTDDRRRVLVEVTAQARRVGRDIWGPLTKEGLAHASRYSVEQLNTILDFLHADRELQERHAARLRAARRRRLGMDVSRPNDPRAEASLPDAAGS